MSGLTEEQLKGAGDVCKKCRAAIVWATTAAGKAIPVDPGPVYGGNLELSLDNVGMLAAKVVRPAGDVEAYVAHFVSCSDPAGFRNKSVPAPADLVPTHDELAERRRQAGHRVMPFGKFAGQYLDDIAGDRRGRGYLEWAYDNLEFREASLRQAIGIVLEQEQ